MFGVINSIVRSSASARESVLSYFAHILRLNEKRAQMQVDPQTVACEGFMHNLAAILLNLCDPFMDVKASKVKKKPRKKRDRNFMGIIYILNLSGRVTFLMSVCTFIY